MKATNTGYYTKEQLKLIEAFFGHSFDGIFIVDKNGKLLLTNPAIEQILNENHTELVGHFINDLISKGIYEGSPAMRSLETKVAYTGLVKTRSGVEIISTSNPILDENGDV